MDNEISIKNKTQDIISIQFMDYKTIKFILRKKAIFKFDDALYKLFEW